MGDDTKQKVVTFLAIFLTIILVMQYSSYQERHRQERQALAKKQLLEAPPPLPPGQENDRPDSGSEAASRTASGEPADDKTSPAPKAAEAGRPAAPATEESPHLREIRIRAGSGQGAFEAVFTTRGAALKRYRLGGFFRTPAHAEGEELILLDELALDRLSLALQSIEGEAIRERNYQLVSVPEDAELSGPGPEPQRGSDGRLVMRTVFAGWEISRTYSFAADDRFGFTAGIELRNLEKKKRKLTYQLVGPAGIVPDDAGRWGLLYGMSAALAARDATETSVKRSGLAAILEAQKKAAGGRIEDGANQDNLLCWVALKNRFFAAVMLADDPDLPREALVRAFPISDKYMHERSELAPLFAAQQASGEVLLEISPGEHIAAGQSVQHGFRFYGGPTDEEQLAFDDRLGSLVDYTVSWFNGISRYLVKLLSLIYGAVGNYGLAIILLTLLVKTVMHPLTRKGLHSSHKMQKVAPLVKEIQRKFKDQREKMHQEVMRLYREHGVSPMGGCLPMLIQLPIFFALYGAFANGFAVRQAPFIPGWIDDLSQPDSLWHWGTPLPLVGWTDLSLLPIIYLIMQVIQMSMQPKSEDPQIQQQQKMMKIMPIVFVFIFYTMPAGLVLYFTVSAIYTLAEHWLIKRGLDQPDGGSGTPARSAPPQPHGPAAGADEAKPASGGAAAGTGIGAPQAGGGKRRKKKRR